MTINNPDVYLEKEFQTQAAEVLQKLGYTLLSSEECHRERGGLLASAPFKVAR